MGLQYSIGMNMDHKSYNNLKCFISFVRVLFSSMCNFKPLK